MAVISNTYTTYDAIGLREDLSDVIDNIAPTETRFLSALKKTKVKARNFDWLVDTLDSAANNAQIEGNDVNFTAITPPVRWSNYAQISSKQFLISRTENIVDKAGRDKEMDYQTVLKVKAMKRDANYALIRNTTYNAGATGTARQTRGLAGWITQGKVGAGAGAFPIPQSNTAPVAGTGYAFDESTLKTMISAAYNAGGQLWTLYVRPADKVLASAFTGNATRYQNVADNNGKLVAAYDVYVSDFGAIKIVPERQCDAAAYLIDHDHVSFAELDGVNRSPLAKTGDAEKMMITWEYGLKVDNKDAHAQARDLL